MNDRHANPIGRPGEAGIIHEVYVKNFMCHRKLSLKLCRNVNFIHGQNGSGKSAILTAIQVCLGAGAHMTHSARNLKDLVRKEAGADCSGAKLQVTLLNKGADSYMPDVYGDYITVERIISMRSGGFNGCKLLDASGKERSRAKKDLDAMLDQLNIHVENPMAVLDQEEAKKFFMGNAEDNYKFFAKALYLMMEQFKSRRDLTDQQKRLRFRQLRGHIAEMTNIGFDECLGKKGSAGEVEFDHEAGQLNLIIQKNNAGEHSQTKDVDALSGGDRRFATLSLFLAIGESLETPFRVIDEFDVFLDPVARKIAMGDLVKVAKLMNHRQFIFITPHDVSNLQTDPKLRIFKMKPPVRSNVVGGAAQQTSTSKICGKASKKKLSTRGAPFLQPDPAAAAPPTKRSKVDDDAAAKAPNATAEEMCDDDSDSDTCTGSDPLSKSDYKDLCRRLTAKCTKQKAQIREQKDQIKALKSEPARPETIRSDEATGIN